MVGTGCYVVSQERGGGEGKDWNRRTLSLGKDCVKRCVLFLTALLQKLKADELDFGEETGEALEEADLGKKSNWNVNAFKLLKFKAFFF